MMNPVHTTDVKARIRATLHATGISQHKLAVFADMSPQTLTRYLAGTTWSAMTERKLERALVRLPKQKHKYRKHTKHRRIDLHPSRTSG
jgi:hypothetical protein